MASLALAAGGSSIGVFLILRRMSLMGDALAHRCCRAPRWASLIGGLSLPADEPRRLPRGGRDGALLSGVIARFSNMREDAGFAAAYLTAMALGVLIVSLRGSAVDLMNILFGAILAVDDQALILVVSTATLTLVGLGGHLPAAGRGMLQSRLPRRHGRAWFALSTISSCRWPC